MRVEEKYIMGFITGVATAILAKVAYTQFIESKHDMLPDSAIKHGKKRNEGKVPGSESHKWL